MINSNPYHQHPRAKTLALWSYNDSMYPDGTNEVQLLIRPLFCQMILKHFGNFIHLGSLQEGTLDEATQHAACDQGEILVSVDITREELQEMLKTLNDDWNDLLSGFGPGEFEEPTPATPSLEPDSFTDRTIANCQIQNILGEGFFIRLLVRITYTCCDESGRIPDEHFVPASITREELTEILRRIDSQEKAWNERLGHL